MQELGVGSVSEDRNEWLVHLRSVHEFDAGLIGAREVAEHNASADLELELRGEKPAAEGGSEGRDDGAGDFEFGEGGDIGEDLIEGAAHLG